MNPTENFRRARDFLLQNREDWKAAYEGFRWPNLDRFNWALDWFDVIADGNGRTALHIVEEYGAEVRLSYHELAERSNRVAVYLRRNGVERGHRILMMLPNSPHLWEIMLAAMKLGAVALVSASAWWILAAATRVERVLSRTGMNILERVAGMLLAAIALQFLIDGAGEAFPGLLR